MSEHCLKTWPEFYCHIIDGTKVHELQKMDRDFKVGDTLRLQEYVPGPAYYTGREALAEITYITSIENACALSPLGLDPSHCILSIKFVDAAIARS